jgi:hypothetical protein
MSGALAAATETHGELEALPLIDPQVEVPVAFMAQFTNRPSRTPEAASGKP